MTLIYSLFLLALFASPGIAQVAQLSVPISATDNSGHRQVIYFGVDPSATYCIDSQLDEFELPENRCGTSGNCVYFVDSRDGAGQCMGWGLLLDLRAYSSPSQSDTYRVACNFQDYPVTFRWDSSLASYYESLTLSNLGNGSAGTLNMLQTDSYVIQGSTANLLQIIASGPRGTTTGVRENGLAPGQFVLGQNYPNPFNPQTNFGFSVPEFGFVSLKVFDVFGREVATLESGMKSPGTYNVSWNAVNQPSGVYFGRLTVIPSSGMAGAGKGFTSSRRMLLLK